MGHHLDRASVLPPKVGDELIPSRLSWDSPHVLIYHGVLVVWNFFVQMGEFEARVCDFEPVECGVHPLKPNVDIFRIEWREIGLSQ